MKMETLVDELDLNFDDPFMGASPMIVDVIHPIPVPQNPLNHPDLLTDSE